MKSFQELQQELDELEKIVHPQTVLFIFPDFINGGVKYSKLCKGISQEITEEEFKKLSTPDMIRYKVIPRQKENDTIFDDSVPSPVTEATENNDLPSNNNAELQSEISSLSLDTEKTESPAERIKRIQGYIDLDFPENDLEFIPEF